MEFFEPQAMEKDSLVLYFNKSFIVHFVVGDTFGGGGGGTGGGST
jgi:hypothetical protein